MSDDERDTGDSKGVPAMSGTVAKASHAAAAPAPYPKILLVTDPAYTEDRVVAVVAAAAKAVPPGVLGVQLRDKRKDARGLRAFAERLRQVTRDHKAKLLVNGNPELARDIGADGVHLGGNAIKVPEAREVFGSPCFVTIAAHSDDAVRFGAEDGANGALVSAIFPVPGKSEGRGVEALTSARKVARPETGFLLYALGGVDHTNAAVCVRHGADGVAVIRALLLASDPGAEARSILEALSPIPS
jgi:thiamine-phosphate pyrophosphorylase